MKRSVLFASLIFLSIFAAHTGLAQKTGVTDIVRKSFTAKYPGAAGSKWISEADTLFEASFKFKGKDLTARFDQDGRWLKTKTVLGSKELPAGVSAGIKQSSPGFKVKGAAKVESPKTGVRYEVVVKKGRKNLELELTPDGLLVRKTDLNAEAAKAKGKDKAKSAEAEIDK